MRPLELELEVLPVPISPVELELELLPVPIRPELEELDELLLLEELLADDELEELPAVELPAVELPAVELPAVELDDEVLVELWPELLCPDDPPSNIAMASASCDGRLTPSVRPGTSIGVELANTNSFLPL